MIEPDLNRLPSNLYKGILLAASGAGVSTGWATHSPVIGISAGVSVVGIAMIFTNVADAVARRLENKLDALRPRPSGQGRRPEGPR